MEPGTHWAPVKVRWLRGDVKHAEKKKKKSTIFDTQKQNKRVTSWVCISVARTDPGEGSTPTLADNTALLPLSALPTGALSLQTGTQTSCCDTCAAHQMITEATEIIKRGLTPLKRKSSQTSRAQGQDVQHLRGSIV